MRTRDFNGAFQSELRNTEFAIEYLRASLDNAVEYNDPGLVQEALLKIMQANRSVSRIATGAGLSRPALYRALSSTGNPEFATVFSILRLLGIQMTFTAKRVSADRATGDVVTIGTRRVKRRPGIDHSAITMGVTGVTASAQDRMQFSAAEAPESGVEREKYAVATG